MSNRLESLNSPRKPPASKPSLKFKPKVVVRKSKEEREKETVVKPEPTPRVVPKNNQSRGPKSRKPAYAGTHVVSAGPLSMGSVSMGTPSGSKPGNTKDMVFNSVSPSPELFQNLKRKTKTETTGSLSEDLDDEDMTRINMNKEYKFADEETVLFPVRPERANTTEVDNTKTPATREDTPDNEPVYVRETSVKSEEPIEEELLKIKEHKAELESKIAEPADLLGQEESEKLARDHEAISCMLSRKMENLSVEEPYFLIQLPQILPQYTNEDGTPTNHGQIGSINIHKSGKVSMNIGNDNTLTLAQGAPSKFVQEVVAMEMFPPSEETIYDEQGALIKGRMYNLGKVDGKLVAIPKVA